MDSQEKAVARKFFKFRILEANGQAFEDLFVRIMSLAVPGFKPIKPHGSMGDRKNDGYVETTSTYYQVYAPEDLKKTHAEATAKLKRDFAGLKKAWPDVRAFYFVMNDKYQGPYPDAAQDISTLKQQESLEECDFILAKDLENRVFSELPDDALIELVNFPPDPSTLSHLDFSILGEVIVHIMKMPSLPPVRENWVAPDWDKKIAFNGLGEFTRNHLNVAAFKVGYIEEYLKNQGDFASQNLRDRMISLYEQAKNATQSIENRTGDDVFIWMWQKGPPRQESPYQDAFLVVLAKYFEACDVFERPEDEPC